MTEPRLKIGEIPSPKHLIEKRVQAHYIAPGNTETNAATGKTVFYTVESQQEEA